MFVSKLIKYIIAFCVFTQTSFLLAQNANDEMGSWFMYFGQNKLHERLSLHTELQMRYFSIANDLNQILARTGINYHLNEKAQLTLGYAYVPNYPFGENAKTLTSDENRIFQQFILTNSFGRFFFRHRYRIEQRWLNNSGIVSLKHRFRYRILLSVPINSTKIEKGTFTANWYDEIFINADEVPFNQNRFYLALGYHILDNLNLQLGYLINHIGATRFKRLQLALFYNLDFTKSNEE